MKKIIFVALCLFLVQSVYGQSYKLTRSATFVNKNIKNEGLISEVVGVNNTHFFVEFMPRKMFGFDLTRITIHAYEIKTMKQTGILQVLNPAKSSENKINARNVSYKVVNDGLYVFISHSDKKDDTYSVYAKVLNNTLREVTPLTKLVETGGSSGSYLVMQNEKVKDFALLYSPKIEKGQQFELLYKFFDKGLKSVSAGQVELPLTKIKSRSSDDYLSEDNFKMDGLGNITAFYSFKIEKEERGKGEKRYASILCYINTSRNTVYNVPLRFDNKNAYQFGFSFTKDNKLAISGFYSDIALDPDGKDIHGMFYLKIDGQKELTEISKFTPFPKDFMTKVEKDNTLLKEKQKNKDISNERIYDNFRFVEIIPSEDNSITAYCEMMYNYSVTTRTQNSTTTTYYSTRGTLFYYNIDEKGEIKWYNTIKKLNNYASGSSLVWFSDYTRISRRGQQDFAMYNTSRNFNMAPAKNGRAVKNENNAELSLSIINNTTGQYKTELPGMNASNLKSWQVISPNSLYFHNNMAIGFGSRLKMKTGWLVGAIVTFPLFLPSIIIFMSQFSREQKYSFGKYDLPVK